MQARIAARHNLSALMGRPTLPVGDNAARLLDNRNERLNIIRLQTFFDDNIDKAGGQQRIIIAIPAIADETRAG